MNSMKKSGGKIASPEKIPWKIPQFLSPPTFWENQDGLALRHASNELKNDWLFVASAVCRDGEALQFASNELRNDAKMVPGIPLVTVIGGFITCLNMSKSQAKLGSFIGFSLSCLKKNVEFMII